MKHQQDFEQTKKNLDIGKEMIYLNQDEVVNMRLNQEDILDLITQALVAQGNKETEMPAKIGVHPYDDVFYHAMPAYVPSKSAVGSKWIESYPSNPKKFSLPQTSGLLTINDVSTGFPVSVMDAIWITAQRTPAVTTLSALTLHPDAETFGMFGAGVQGTEHVKYLGKSLKNLKEIYIYDTNTDAMDKLVSDVQPLISPKIIKASSAEDVVKNCELLSSATLIVKEPMKIVKKEWISKGQTILPCDLNTFWDPEIAHSADKFFVDSIEEHELFDEMGYFPDGLPKIIGETGELLNKDIKGRENKDDIIVCSNIGMAVCDIVVGKELFNRALNKGIGTKLKL